MKVIVRMLEGVLWIMIIGWICHEFLIQALVKPKLSNASQGVTSERRDNFSHRRLFNSNTDSQTTDLSNDK